MDEFDESVEDEAKVSGKFLPGTLYFMQETDYLSGETFEYYKIGIVRGKRDVEDREKDHKTGNPRRIASIKDIESPAVQRLETHLHNTLAKHRVSSGEWFYLPGDLLAKAIKLAEATREKIVANSNGLLLYANKNRVSHSGASVSNSETLKDLAEEMLIAQSAAKQAAGRRKIIGQALKELAGNDEKFEFLFKISNVEKKESFDTAAFSKAHKDIYNEFKTKQSSSWSLNILIKLENASPSDGVELDGLSPLQMHDAYLEAWSSQEATEFKHALLEAQLIATIGDAVSVDGVLEWKESKRVSFDSAKFKLERPELVAQFMKETPAKINKAPAEWASYRH